MRACRNAIEFNSIPSIKRLIPEVSDLLNEIPLMISEQYFSPELL